MTGIGLNASSVSAFKPDRGQEMTAATTKFICKKITTIEKGYHLSNCLYLESSSVDMASASSPQKLYFAYGSNLWLQQMDRRCPTSTYKGLARLFDWRWIINTRGYANVIPSHGDEVWGMLYALPPPDEAKLDINEGVPFSYQKKELSVETWFEDAAGKNVDISRPGKWETVLCYVDVSRVDEAKPKDEYVHRVNMGIRDARRLGMPDAFVHKFLRPFIPADKAGELS